MGTIDLISSLELQLAEVEMLKSMYPEESEFYITVPAVIADINSFISGESRQLPHHLDYNVNLQIFDVNEKIEVNINLPHDYPNVVPNVSARSVGLNRSQQKELNLAISSFLDSQCEGELAVVSLVTWLTENAIVFFTPDKNTSDEKRQCKKVPEVFSRLWIYSHHIYNKFKRKDIIDLAHDFNLSGFSLPGKPGFICVEGFKKDCDGFLLSIKNMTWKRLSLVKEETDVVASVDDVDGLRKFGAFEEISFHVRRGPAREYHMDMGQFFTFLEDHNCAYAFQDLLGLEGHHSADKT